MWHKAHTGTSKPIPRLVDVYLTARVAEAKEDGQENRHRVSLVVDMRNGAGQGVDVVRESLVADLRRIKGPPRRLRATSAADSSGISVKHTYAWQSIHDGTNARRVRKLELQEHCIEQGNRSTYHGRRE